MQASNASNVISCYRYTVLYCVVAQPASLVLAGCIARPVPRCRGRLNRHAAQLFSGGGPSKVQYSTTRTV